MRRAIFHGVPDHLINQVLDRRAVIGKGDVRALQ
jgi:hypothetical protein